MQNKRLETGPDRLRISSPERDVPGSIPVPGTICSITYCTYSAAAWQHRLNRETPNLQRAKSSSMTADGRVATAAPSHGRRYYHAERLGLRRLAEDLDQPVRDQLILAVFQLPNRETKCVRIAV